TRALGPVLISQLQGALLGSPLPVSQSFILIWPQLTGLVAATIVIFVIAYIVFQRQEIRAWGRGGALLVLTEAPNRYLPGRLRWFDSGAGDIIAPAKIRFGMLLGLTIRDVVLIE